VAPLRLGGLRGKQSTPSDWLGGTGELSTVGERERQGARSWVHPLVVSECRCMLPGALGLVGRLHSMYGWR
jgi:hypothetical protein